MSVSKLNTLQAGRGLAALAIVLCHMNRDIFGGKYFDLELSQLFRSFSAGVEYFFVLSGFLMTWLYRDRLGRPAQVADFLSKRLFRIFPLYWIVLTVLIPVYFIVPTFGHGYERDLVAIVASYLLIPLAEHPSILGVSWTLSYELLFYGAFAVLLWRPVVGLALFVMLGLTAFILQFMQTPFPLSFIFSGYVPLFMYGMIAALIAKGNVARPAILASIGLVVLLTSMLGNAYGDWPVELVRNGAGLGSALAMIGFVKLEAAGRVAVARPLVWTGEISYSLYLIHFPALSVGAKLLTWLGVAEHAPYWLSAVLLFAGALVAGAALHHLVEKPLLKLGLDGLLAKIRRPRPPSAARPAN